MTYEEENDLMRIMDWTKIIYLKILQYNLTGDHVLAPREWFLEVCPVEREWEVFDRFNEIGLIQFYGWGWDEKELKPIPLYGLSKKGQNLIITNVPSQIIRKYDLKTKYPYQAEEK